MKSRPFAGSDYDIVCSKYTDVEELKAAIADAALIFRSDKITPECWTLPEPEDRGHAGAGYDNIDLPAATKNGVVVMNTPGQNANAVAELVIALMIFQARNHMDGSSGTELIEKNIGLLAYGNVGKAVARIAKGFKMNVFAYDPYLSKEAIEADGVKVVGSRQRGSVTCQYVSLHIRRQLRPRQHQL